MDHTKPPWWKRKRWRLAILAWLAAPVLYVFGNGPACYCHARRWISKETYVALYQPLWRTLDSGEAVGLPGLQEWHTAHLAWWGVLGLRHRRGASD